MVEVHRLAVEGDEPSIANNVGARLCSAWFQLSRYGDAAVAATRTLSMRPSASASYDLGFAMYTLGRPAEALQHLRIALEGYRAKSDRGNEGAVLTAIGIVSYGIGDLKGALNGHQRCLEISRQLADHQGEAASLTNIGLVLSDMGDHKGALTHYEQDR